MRKGVAACQRMAQHAVEDLGTSASARYDAAQRSSRYGSTAL